jgi:hypothetical protein
MNDSQPSGNPLPSDPPSPPVCEICGRTDPVAIGDRWLCADCIAVAGSCCPEFGAFDAATAAVDCEQPEAERAGDGAVSDSSGVQPD